MAAAAVGSTAGQHGGVAVLYDRISRGRAAAIVSVLADLLAATGEIG